MKKSKVYEMPSSIKKIVNYINNHGEKQARKKFGVGKVDKVIFDWMYLD